MLYNFKNPIYSFFFTFDSGVMREFFTNKLTSQLKQRERDGDRDRENLSFCLLNSRVSLYSSVNGVMGEIKTLKRLLFKKKYP